MERDVQHDTRNLELPLLAELRKPAPVELPVLASFGDDEEEAVRRAIRWAWDNRRIRRMSQRRAAELCGMPASHFCNMLAGDKYLPPQKINQFEWIVGNTALTQTIARFREVRE